ncbi:MAG: acyl-ACP--UDP-N-acetylglucosamine O-acyltransferase [Helicobacteraceae bacterium]|jgi:UDP-N-acetylglucosamine acyltransferase|nr:acyl-ACP--UDP-N-acetylglucosamine O-acyltransferase [Helicobacteraceae bacterium]
MLNIHATAIIEEGASIAKTVVVGAYAFVGKEVSIGEGSSIGRGAHIEGRTTIGANCKIFPLASIGTAPQDLKYDGEPTRLIIGDRVTIREFCQINIGTVGGGGVTRIGDDCLLMGHVHVAHDNQIGAGCIIANFVALAGHVEIGDFAVIGGMSAIHQFTRIGSYAMIAGASAVSQDIPPFVLAEGNRAKVKGLNLIGLRRRFSREAIDALKPIYKEVFRTQSAPATAARKALDRGGLSREAGSFCEFIVASKRGVARAHLAQEKEEV